MKEAQIGCARTDKEQALPDEQAAGAGRERAEVEERAATAQREAGERASHAQEERPACESPKAKAEKLAPGLAQHDGRHAAQDGAPGQDGTPVRETVRHEETVRREGSGGATRA